jgi:hypothetical protein
MTRLPAMTGFSPDARRPPARPFLRFPRQAMATHSDPPSGPGAGLSNRVCANARVLASSERLSAFVAGKSAGTRIEIVRR